MHSKTGLQRDHEVTAFVRDETKLLSLVERPVPPNLLVSSGDISKSAGIARVMVGHDVAINAASHVTDGENFAVLTCEDCDIPTRAFQNADIATQRVRFDLCLCR